jgi:hypothetical protein
MDEPFRPGDVVRLTQNIGEIGSGLWAVTDIGWLLTLTHVGANEDGDLCTLRHQVKITRDEAEQLVPLNINLYDTAPGGEEKEA